MQGLKLGCNHRRRHVVTMAVSETAIAKSVEILRRCGATRVVLFGSARTDPRQARDLDLACAGLSPRAFLQTVGQLLDEVEVKVDLIDLSAPTPFSRFIEETGTVIYEQRNAPPRN